GPLELFRDPKERPRFTELFNQYLEELGKLADLHAVTAGYVDRPRSDLLVRLLELVKLPDPDLRQAGSLRPFHGVADIDLFHDRLGPGERSAVFAIQSSSASSFTGRLALHFFYLNVGRPGKPYLTRVEMPAWVANDPGLLDRLHSALVGQCLQMGSRPFPYAIHRAHEVAVVTREEKEHLQSMIVAELMRAGIWATETSNKQFHKDNSGNRTEYRP
ncbi:MAG: DNA double-strand break repair nuclease NurA, partial [Chloroflexi bacterium]|nr:DNA double-strand break repair nuclease NurA [Chloroflexota bacterium]